MISSKADVFDSFKEFQAMVTNHFNGSFTISKFRCDNGREYLSSEMQTYFKNKGIHYEQTVPYTPQLNSVAERMWRSLVERARCMLLGSGLPKYLWTEALRSAAYIVNRSPTSALNGQVPANLWYGSKQDLSKLRVFGCPGS